ncbi:MAG TPA: DUF1990 domain-containing protein [Acidimicrobiales bacterium]|nr:DUF1990 domain-containing protein [Acidimicrobiales bacterium]
MLRFQEPTPEDLDHLLTVAEDHDFSYSDLGSTRAGFVPPGYSHDRCSLVLGPDTCFDAAVSGLKHWAAHKHAGARVFPDDPVSSGATHIIVSRVGPLWVLAPVRLVFVTDRLHHPDSFSFAYGTLPGHPEQGEQCFTVQSKSGGEVEFEVVAFYRPGELFAKAVGRVTTSLQHTLTRRYLEGLRSHVAAT